MKCANVKCTFVTTGFPENRHRYLQKIPNDDDSALNEYEDDEAEAENEEEEEDASQHVASTVNIKGRAGKFKSNATIQEKYSDRPKQLENMCLAHFAIHYGDCKEPKNAIFDGNVSKMKVILEIAGTNMEVPKYIALLNNKYFMRLRNIPFILRIHSSKKKRGNK